MNWDWDKLKAQQQGRDGKPPQMDDILKNFKNVNFSGGPIIIVIILVIALAYTMVYKVAPNEVGIVQRFGEYVRTEPPGLHFKLPFRIEKVTPVDVLNYNTEKFDVATLQENRSFSSFSGGENNPSLMLTGDLNVAIVPWIVQYQKKDPYNYLFKVQNVKGLLRDMSEASMRLVVGDRSINEVISKRDEIAIEAREVLQKELDQAEAGILVTTIAMQTTNVPERVQPSFNEVNQAKQEKEQMIYQAQEEYNKSIPAARGEAERTIKAGEGYALDRVNRAKGDAARFTAMYQEYAKAKDITMQRLYLETMRDLYPKLDQKYIIDSEQNNLLPLLNLGKNKDGLK